MTEANLLSYWRRLPSSPAGRHEGSGVELPWAWEPMCSSSLRGLVKAEDPDIVFLSETKRKAIEMERIHRRLGLSNRLFVDCSGEGRSRSGGLAPFWKDSLEMTLKSWSLHHIKMEGMGDDNTPTWRITGVLWIPK